jgi:dsDNA-specific endonuclease/ATPase MutS2
MDGKKAPMALKILQPLLEEMKRYTEARRQLVRSFEEINALYDSVDRSRRGVREKAEAMEALQGRQRLQRKGVETLLKDLRMVRRAGVSRALI